MVDLINDKKYFIDAVELLEEQIKSNKNSKLYLLNFDFFHRKYNRTIFSSEKKIEKYYNLKIKDNVFYSLEENFYIYKYSIPKGLFGLRKYVFFSYELYLLYYSIGLYINDLAKIKIEYKNLLVKNLKLEKSYYKTYSGTKINYDNKGKIITGYDVYKYNNHYNNFYKDIKKYSKFEGKNKIIIKLDLQNFFDDIDINILLDFLDGNIQNKINLKFNSSQKEEIIDFFTFIGFKKGIPQSDENIISSYLSDLYLLKSDFKIIDFLKKKKINFSFIRYIDDTYLIFDEDNLGEYKENSFLLLQKFGNIIYNEVNIRLNNNKNSIYYIDSNEKWDIFIKNIKNISNISHVIEEDDDGTIDEKIKNVFKVIDNIKKSGIKNSNIEVNYENKDLNKLNNIFSKYKEGENILNKILKDNKIELLSSFKDFNFYYINFINKALLALIVGTKGGEDGIDKIYADFIYFIKKINIETIYDVFIFLEFLVNDKTIFNIHSKDVIKTEYIFLNHFYNNKNIINNKLTGTYLNIDLKPYIIEQIKYRIICEESKEYSKAFSHLLNEFHNIIFNLDKITKRSIKKYDQNDVKSFLMKLGTIDNSLIINIGDFFDRRNKNNISHGNGVSLNNEEYIKYREIVFDLYKKL